jgi:glucose/arabinose dehydrogenase
MTVPCRRFTVDLLVSQPDHGSVVELRPGSGGTATVTTLLSGLTWPQGLAFARLDGQWVLYVAESDQIDRYPWSSGGISAARTVIASGLPDLDPRGDDVHQSKDVAVAADGTAYFNVGSSSNANPDDRKPAVTLIGGFENSDGSYWGRPVDAVPGPDGALYVSDDRVGAIYRLAPKPSSGA